MWKKNKGPQVMMLKNIKLWEMDLLNKTPFERQLSFLNQDKLLNVR